MSKQQSVRRCWKCGPVSLSHRCESEQRPQAKMRGPVDGASVGTPQWGEKEWAAHLRTKVAPVMSGQAGSITGKPNAGGGHTFSAADLVPVKLEHGGKVMPGDVFSFCESERYEVTAVDEIDSRRSHRVHAKHYGRYGTWSTNKDACPFLTGPFKLLSRAQKAERA